jgi:hypothetical protein
VPRESNGTGFTTVTADITSRMVSIVGVAVRSLVARIDPNNQMETYVEEAGRSSCDREDEDVNKEQLNLLVGLVST